MATINGTTNGTAHPKITLYTNHGCPWAHRAHIALKELGLPFSEVIIDLDTPREAWFLKINPRGLVPAMDYEGHIITESGPVAQFLADAHPSHLCPPSEEDPLFRWKVNFFVDTYFTKINPLMFAVIRESDAQKREEKAEEMVKAVGKEIEWQLPGEGEGAGPFFGGKKELTLAEVQIASFLLRLYDFSDGVVFPKSMPVGLDGLPRFKRWAHACMEHPSVNYIWDGPMRLQRVKERLGKMRPEGSMECPLK